MKQKTRREFLATTAVASGLVSAAPLLGASTGVASAALVSSRKNDPGVAQQAWRELLSMLHDADHLFISQERGVFDAKEMAAGYRNLTNVLSFAIDMYVENDPDWPTFVPLASPTVKMLGGNPDSGYFYAPVRGDRRYKISGQRGDEIYMSFTSHFGERSSGMKQRFGETLNHHKFKTDANGRFEIILSQEREGDNWLRLAPDAAAVIGRTYVMDNKNDRIGTFIIEPLDDLPPPPRLTQAEVAQRLRDLTNWFREQTSIVIPQPLHNPNVFSSKFQYKVGDESADWATTDNIYASGAFRLDPDEALVIEGVVVPCDYWGIQLWSPMLVSPDWRHYPCWINNSKANLGKKGEFRVAIAHKDPKVPGYDWISTAGERQGTFFVRWLVSREAPPMPTAKLVKLSELRA